MSPLTPSLSLWFLAIFALGLVLPGSASAAACAAGEKTRIWTAPLQPRPGEPMEMLAVSTDGALEPLRITDPAGRQTTLRGVAYGGPPWGLHGGIFRPQSGTYRIEATRRGQPVACTEVRVGGGAAVRGDADWDLATSALFAVWIERLFDAPPEQSLSFDSLAPVLRNPERNFFYGYLGGGEDERLPADPDCADLPYFLRAYFAWKLGLAVAYRPCSRGSRSSPPRCEAPTVDTSFVGSPVAVSGIKGVTRRIMDTVHSGSGRTALSDDSTDFYPVALERSALWPGTLYADPYGHTLILVKWLPQRPGRPGRLLAVDAQPDNSMARKRFWEGTFLFAETPSAGPGFKAFRPLTRTAGGALRPLSNSALDGRSGLPAFSLEQSGLAPADFYARMERLINPDGLDPDEAYAATLAALMEQLKTRVDSVETGESFMRAHPGTVIPMPAGPAIFETTGAWEDYATPSRDMRLLIAMNVLEELPERIRRYPDLYVLRGDSPEAAAARIELLHTESIERNAIEYRRSDASPWRLTVADIYSRRPGLQIAYNPNDCVERRWGAAPGSADYSTCRRQAPAEQRRQMEEYRPWFRETRRPPR